MLGVNDMHISADGGKKHCEVCGCEDGGKWQEEGLVSYCKAHARFYIQHSQVYENHWA